VVALLTSPTLILAVLWVLTRFSADFTPRAIASTDLAAVVALGVIGGLMAGLLEELGWTGFATPRLLRRHGVLITGLLIGVPWWAWHLLADYWGGAQYGEIYFLHALLWGVALPAYRILMTWVYEHTGSLLVAALMHASFTGGQAIFEPVWTTPTNAVVWYGLFAAALWAVVASILLGQRKMSPCNQFVRGWGGSTERTLS
jgi:membrane protease YdiL (CAAX protease family)